MTRISLWEMSGRPPGYLHILSMFWWMRDYLRNRLLPSSMYAIVSDMRYRHPVKDAAPRRAALPCDHGRTLIPNGREQDIARPAKTPLGQDGVASPILTGLNADS